MGVSLGIVQYRGYPIKVLLKTPDLYKWFHNLMKIGTLLLYDDDERATIALTYKRSIF